MTQKPTFDFSDVSVLVTGGSNGIGLATAKAYRDAGAIVTVTGRRASAADYDNDLTGLDYRQLDVQSKDAVYALAEDIDSLDILMANAGGAQGDEWSREGFEQSLAINLASVFHCSAAFWPHLEKSAMPGGASIIGVASMTSYFGFDMIPGYGASKAGLVQLMKTLAIKGGSVGVRANAVAAGLTRSNMTDGFIGMQEAVQPTLDRQAIKRVGEADDIADAILFLTSSSASWITGQTLPVDGGYTITMT